MSIASTKIQRPRLRTGLATASACARTADCCRRWPSSRWCCCARRPVAARPRCWRVRSNSCPSDHGVAWITLDPGDDLHRLLQCLWQALEPFDLPWRTSPEGLATMATSRDPRQQQQAADTLVNTLEACELDAWRDRARRPAPCRRRRGDGLSRPPAASAGRTLDAGHRAPATSRRCGWRGCARWACSPSCARPSCTSRAKRRWRCCSRRGWTAAWSKCCSGAHRAGRPDCGWRWAVPAVADRAAAIDRQAFDYLSAEVLQQLDPALHEFLLRTSVLQELDAARCQALTGDPRAWTHLDAHRAAGPVRHGGRRAAAHAEAARPVPRRPACTACSSSGATSGWR